MSIYSKKFYENLDDGSFTSAGRVLALLPNQDTFSSLLDVGCGAGSWMRAAEQVLGIDPVQMVGIDGLQSSVAHRSLKEKVVYQDLSKPLEIKGTFDLAVCVEVAEHLPQERADSLVADLCSRSRVVIFSAAVPGQGGTGHVNEQWPDYWARKFAANGFDAFDLFRPQVWNDSRVAPWYAQNCFLYLQKGNSMASSIDASRISAFDDWRLRLVHPGILQLAACESAGLTRIAKALPGRVLSGIGRRLRKR